MKKIIIGALTALTILSGSAMAEDFALGVSAGTMGIGLEETTSIAKYANVRVLAAGFNYSKDGTSGDVTYHGTAKILNAGILLDYYPFENGLRLTAGGMYNGTKVSLDGKPAGGTNTYTLNGNTYTAAQVGSISGDAKYEKIMPYIGIGFSNPIKGSKITFGMDIGAMIGKPTADLTVTNPTNNATLAADAAVEKAKLQNDANKVTAYPVIQFNVAYRF